MAERPSRVLMPAEVHRHPAGALVLPPGVGDPSPGRVEVTSPSELRWRHARAAWASPAGSAFLGRYYREKRRRGA